MNIISKIPLVSVIVPSYNHERYILRCLESIVSQTYQNIELIIVDDGSEDNSARIVNEWIKEHRGKIKRVIYHSQKINKGITYTINKGIEFAQGEFIAFVASDDYLLPRGIDMRVKKLIRNTDWYAVIGDAQIIDEHDNIVSQSAFRTKHSNINALKNPVLIRPELTTWWAVVGPVFMGRRKIFNKEIVGPFDEEIVVEDRDFYLRLLALEPIRLGYVDYPVAAYRVHNKNTSLHPPNLLLYTQELYKVELKNIACFSGIAKLGIILRALNYWYVLKQMSDYNRYRKPLALLIRSCQLLLHTYIYTLSTIFK